MVWLGHCSVQPALGTVGSDMYVQHELVQAAATAHLHHLSTEQGLGEASPTGHLAWAPGAAWSRDGGPQPGGRGRGQGGLPEIRQGGCTGVLSSQASLLQAQVEWRITHADLESAGGGEALFC